MKIQSKRCLSWLAAAGLIVPVVAVSGPLAASASVRHASASAPVTIGVDLTYNNTAFWAAYDNYENQYAKQLNIKILAPLLSSASASLQNQQVEAAVNEGAKAVVVNPETATSMGPAIAYAAKKGVQVVMTDTIIGAGHAYMIVRASNLLYGWDACAYIASRVQSGYVLDLEGDLLRPTVVTAPPGSTSAWRPTCPRSISSRTRRSGPMPPPSPMPRTPSMPTGRN